MTERAVSEKTWEEFERELFTPEEIAESDKRVAEICREIESRKETETQEK